MAKPIAFVIMSFAPEQRGVYDAVIKPTFEEDLGWECWRVDERRGAGNIVRQIVEGIAQATLVVADLTALQSHVLYELGVAHTLGVPVLTLAQRGGEAMPFDLRSYRYLEYEDTAAGARRL
jgi:nucleoside 2-deoxyribosyltransferase